MSDMHAIERLRREFAGTGWQVEGGQDDDTYWIEVTHPGKGIEAGDIVLPGKNLDSVVQQARQFMTERDTE